jgi:ABC-type multidrug transport system fused ATPase/permease subunit
LSDLDLTINGNESVALVGHSGSGKSTIASLLLRFYDKQKGKILIDGLEIEKYPVKYIRDQIAIVMQEPLLFNESIKDNIKYGNLDATDLQVLEAA